MLNGYMSQVMQLL